MRTQPLIIYSIISGVDNNNRVDIKGIDDNLVPCPVTDAQKSSKIDQKLKSGSSYSRHGYAIIWPKRLSQWLSHLTLYDIRY